jgi:DNA-binding NarL/FixJ family response regulator
MSIRVLLIETDTVVAELLSQWVKQRGMEVVACVNTAEDALKACEKHKPELAFVALKVLPTSALELVQQMRAQCPSLQVLVSSFWAFREEIKEAKLWGAKAGFSRPPSPEGFQHALEACEGLPFLEA